MNESKYVTVGKPKITGAVYAAPVGTTLPTNATAELNSAFEALGYISSDGLTNSNSPSTGDIKAWGGDTVYTYLSSKDDTFKYTLIEALRAAVLKVVYGADNVSGDLSTGITIKANSSIQEAMSWVFDIVLNNALKRIVVPQAAVTAVGDIKYADESAVGYDTTIKAFPDASGNTHYEYIIAADDDGSEG